MKKTKILSLLLCLSLFCALIVPCTKAYAKSDPDSGMKISKTATANGDGSYTITLEAFATGSKVITEQKTDIPTDIVLVLDQSGSMEDPIGGYTYTAYRKGSEWNSRNYHNEEYYPLRHNGGSENLWYKLNNNEYIAVSVEQKMEYTDISDWDNGDYYSNQNNLYCLVNGEYKRVNVTSSWGKYEYYVDGSKIGSGTYLWNEPTFDNGYAPLYQSVNKYIYSYTLNGATTVIEESIGDGSSPNTQFYRRDYSSSAGGTRLNALKNAVTNFTEEVAKKAAGKDGKLGTNDDVDHRIAVVGFASQSGYGNNTELLSIAGKNSGSVGVAYDSITNQNLKDVLQSMDTQNGREMVNAAITALAANGATRTELGMNMAQQILNANPVPTGETRNRVVIVFTDGSPTNSNGFQRAVANRAISTADAIKAGGTTVYSIGIFPGADASTAGKEPDEDYYEDSWGWTNYTDAEMSAACNWFMQKVSSNNGTPRTPSYYLSAGDSASLNSIFQQISNQIETGGSSSTLTSEAVVKDIISPYFTLPEGATDANITLETYKYTGENQWEKNTNAMGATATVNGDQVNVTGFNFSENYVGTVTENGNTTYRGNKLVISFKVQPKDGFLGGNDVITNTNAGIYENSNAKDPIMTFDQPTVNVPIKDVTVKADDKNVYLKGEVTADQLKNGAKVSVGGVNLDLSQATNTDKPYGLEKWQTEYVNIAVEVKDNAGKPISDKLDNLTDDTTYTVEVTVAPTTEATSTDEKGDAATAKTGFNDPAANIYVFKPELTYKDSEVYYGDTAPTDFSGNLTNTEWKHGETKSTDSGVTMIGTAPTLDPTYTPEAGKIADGKINTKEDISVDVSVKIRTDDVTTYTTFQHTDCTGKTCTLPAGAEFLLHVKTCTLTVQKTGGDSNEPYVFNIYKDNVKYSEVTIVGNRSENIEELPVGEYTIKEDTGWSWRFNPNPSYSENVILSKDNTSGTITCTNTKNNDQWLNGFSDVVKNIFDVSHNN